MSDHQPDVRTLFEELFQSVSFLSFFVIINETTTLNEHPIKTQGTDHVIATIILLKVFPRVPSPLLHIPAL